MHFVRAGFGYHVNGSAGVQSVLCRQRTRFHFKFLQRIGKWKGQTYVRIRIVMIGSIENVVCGVAIAARDRHIDRARIDATVSERCGRNRRTGKHDQLGHLTAVQRKFFEPALIDHLADAGLTGFDHRRIRCHLNRFGCRPHFHGDLNRRVRIYLQNDTRLDIGAEAGQRCFKFVGSHWQVRKRVRACFIRQRRSAKTGFGLRCVDLDSWNQGTRGVFHRAIDLCNGLSP